MQAVPAVSAAACVRCGVPLQSQLRLRGSRATRRGGARPALVCAARRREESGENSRVAADQNKVRFLGLQLRVRPCAVLLALLVPLRRGWACTSAVWRGVCWRAGRDRQQAEP